ncbi:MAG: DegQ family serine endoprotease [Deltaproteobacteria bacterium]
MKRFLSFAVLIPLIALAFFASCERAPKNDAKEPESGAQQGAAEIPAQGFPSFADLVQTMKPSVVNISTTSVVRQRGFQYKSPFGEGDQFEEFFKKFFGQQIPQREFRQKGLGSGFIISEDGYIVTNNHVIDRAEDIEIILEDGKKYKAKIVGKDPKTDLALLKIEAKEEMKAVVLGDSSALRIGDWVIAIGNPFGLGHTVTAGIVSATGRVLGLGNYDDFIQTDAAINPGNSGGPLFNLKGEVVGVDSAIIAGGQGIGFAIPINIVKSVVEQLKGKGKVVRGWLGVSIQSVTPEIAEGIGLGETQGALVADITPQGPAEKSGLKRGDIIIALNGESISTVSELTSKVAQIAPGSKATLKVMREGGEREIALVVGELPDQIALGDSAGEDEEAKIEEKLGLNGEAITPELKSRFNLSEDSGVVIIEVSPGGIAEESGFRAGDFIIEINRIAVGGIGDYKKGLGDIQKRKNGLFLIKREENTIYMGVKME